MAKRNCRRTANENIIHNKAVKMRKMTDEQLVNYVENKVEEAQRDGFNKGKEQAVKCNSVDISEIIKDIGNVKGIGTAKLADIKGILEKYLAG